MLVVRSCMQSPGSRIPRPIAGAYKRFLIWYAGAFVGLFGLLGVLVVARGAPVTIVPRVLKQAFVEVAGHWLFWLVLLIPYVVLLWLRSVLRGYGRRGGRGLARSLRRPSAPGCVRAGHRWAWCGQV